MTLHVAGTRSAPAPQYFPLTVHADLAHSGRYLSTAVAFKEGRLVTVAFILYCMVDRTALVGVEPLIYIPEALAPLGLDPASDAENSGTFSPWFICDANSVLGGGYPDHWPMRFQAYYGTDPDIPDGIYDQHAFGRLFSPIDGDEERVEVHGAFTYVSLS